MCAAFPSPRTAEIVVVGAGVIGLATTAHLNAIGVDVLCLEAAQPGEGQSRGEARIFRHLHGDDRLTAFARDTRELWDHWAADAGTVLLGDEGVVVTTPDAKACADRLARQDVDVALLDAGTQRETSTVFVGSARPAVLDRRGGVIRVRATIDHLRRSVGERLQPGRVLRAQPDATGGALVHTDAGTVSCGQVLFTAGAGTAGLAAASGIAVDVAFHSHVRATFAVRRPDERMAAWIDHLGEFGESVYGGPLPCGTRYVLGLNGIGRDLALRSPDDDTTPAAERRRVSDLDALAAVARRALPGVDPAVVGSVRCVTTSLPSGGDEFALHSHGPIHAFAGNNLFKFAPGLAVLLADAVSSGTASGLLTPGLS